MKLLNKLKSNKQANIKKIKIIWIIAVIIILLSMSYSLIFEQDKIAIDRYNFKELEKVRLILKEVPREQYKFRNFNDFNKKYWLWIKPIKNCYYMVSTNYFDNYNQKQWIWYIFWFKIESVLYKFRYLNWYYAYPKYDLPIEYFCDWWKKCDADMNLNWFENDISNPCRD